MLETPASTDHVAEAMVKLDGMVQSHRFVVEDAQVVQLLDLLSAHLNYTRFRDQPYGRFSLGVVETMSQGPCTLPACLTRNLYPLCLPGLTHNMVQRLQY